MRTRAPATSANLGPGFDCAAVALDLWNEVEVTEGADRPPDPVHIGIRSFGLVASPEGLSFEWTDRIPRARGLGSSAATIALGMVAAAKWTGQELELEDLLARGGPLEGHSDNLAACLAGGACLTWDGRIARIADSLPLSAVAVIPEEKVSTAEARLALPGRDRRTPTRRSRSRGLRSSAPGSRAGARSSSPRRSPTGCTSRTGPPRSSTRCAPSSRQGAVGATLSGSGPTVIVWADDPDACAAELEGRFSEAIVMPLAVSGEGAH